VFWWRPKWPEQPAKTIREKSVSQARIKGFSENAAGAEIFDALPRGGSSVPHPATSSSPQSDATGQPFASTGPQGHRARMREKLLNRGPDALADYELLEMLLFYAMPKGDTKPLAKALINRFGSFASVLTAPQKELFAVSGLAEFGIAALKLVHASSLRLIKAELADRPILNNWDRLTEYLNAVLGRERIEQFRVLFLDSKNRLLSDDLLGRGTFNHTPVYPREVLKRALELNAGAIILVHNHPSGDPTPSEDDVVVTEEIKAAANLLQIVLHDHVIIANGRWFSLRRSGML
jgi:DNA repair protein RadC